MIYGAELGFGSIELIAAILLVQFVGIPFALIFGRIPNRTEGRRQTYLAFIVFNLVALPLVGIIGARTLDADYPDLSVRAVEKLARKLGLASMVSVPMNVQNNKVIGVLNCFTSHPYCFTETEVNLITTVANQAAVAIMNTELMVKTRVIQEELETRKLVERAKEVLMRRRNMTGAQAHRWIQKRSMDSRKSMLHVAEAILLSDEL